MSVKHVLTTCPYCGCGCNFYLQVVDNRLVGVVPCKTDEIGQGRLCIKGYNAYAFVQNPDRLTHPMVRDGHQLRKATWDEALDRIVSEIKKIVSKHGPDSVVVFASARCTNEENYLMQKFARAAIGTNNVDHCARLCHASTVAGLVYSFGSGAMTNSIPEFENADCILVTGSNTLETHPLIGARIVKALYSGAKVIVVDPRETPLSRLAQLSLHQKPGTDIAWIHGIANVIISEDLVDKEFVATKTKHFEELKKVVAEYTPEKVEKLTGIPKEKLMEVARVYAKSKKSMIAYAMGITQHSNGTAIVKSLANLSMLTGHIGKESTGVNPLRGQNNVQGACDAGSLPNFYPGYQLVANGDMKAKFEKAWGQTLSDKPGLTITEAIEKAATGEIKAVITFGENMMISDPDITHVEKALSNLEFFAVADIFPTETSKFAHVVLPAACYAEKDGTFTNTDRKVRRVRKAVDGPGEALPDWEIVCELGRRYGAQGFDFNSVSDIMDEFASVAPAYGGISFDRLEKEMLTWPCPSKDHAGTRILHVGGFKIGKGQFAPVSHEPPAEEPSEDYPMILTTGRNLFQYHTGTMTRRTPKLERESPEPYVEIHKADAKPLGVEDGDRVRISSRRGSITLAARVTDRITEGVIFVPFHYAEAAANMLTNPVLDPIAKIPELKVCAARVEKA
ncbi:MAG: formate dehydrogenase subunit alpha [Thermoplasmata archaeon]|nr:formate dehydrogenase subunit alpha [Thermoplasmata archaeon]